MKSIHLNVWIIKCCPSDYNLYKQQIICSWMHQKSFKPTSQRDLLSQPLLWLPESALAIFPDRIVKYSPTRGKPISAGNVTLPSLGDLEETDRVISFSKDDISFRVDEAERRVRIVKIKNEKTELQFVVQKQAQLLAVQEILRRKLCELGFEDKFKIIKQLGKGATAKVYLVERISDKKYFAAKIMSLKTSQNKDYETFINESKILKCLKNPYIVGIQSLYISKKQLISVLQYLEGGTLLDQLRSDLIRTDRGKLKVIRDLTEGIQHLRQKRIVHRDLKLQNIMIRINKDKTKDYVITDFGLACWIGQKDLLFQKCGTPGYIAPEILRANKTKIIVSHLSDIFSLGVIAHFVFLLRAIFPYNGDAKELLLLNKKASFSLQTRIHLQLLCSELTILHKTLQLNVERRVTSRELLDVYLKEYEREVNEIENKRLGTRVKKVEEEVGLSTRKNVMKMGNSIEAIEKKQPSVDKKQFMSNRYKTQSTPRSEREEKKESSVGKLINKVKSIFTSTEVLKTKQQSSARKRQMKNYLF